MNTKTKNSFFIYLFIIFLPFSWASLSIGSVYRALTIGLFVLFVINSKFKFTISVDNTKVFISWLLYIGYCILTTFWAVNFQAAISNSLSLILLGLIVLVFYSTHLSKKNIKQIDKCWVIVGVTCAFLYIFGDKTAVGDYGSRTSMIIMGTATDPNEFASAFIVPVSLLLFHILHADKKSYKLLYIVLICLSLYCVLLSGSRGALISVIMALLITFLLNRKISIKTMLITILTLAIFIFLFIQFIVPLIPTDVLNRLSLNALIEDGGSGRKGLWLDALNQIWNGSLFRLFFGHGQYGLTAGTEGLTQTMHNQFLQQLSNYGIIGLLIYCNLLFQTYKLIVRRCPKYIGAFWGLMIMSMTITMSVAYKILWIVLLVPVLYKKQHVKEDYPKNVTE